jgi:hypothetical protein
MQRLAKIASGGNALRMNLKIENKLNINNIDKTIELYINSMREMDTCISAETVFELLRKIKRQPVTKGPYSGFGIALLEATNRMLNDLVILYGVKDLLRGRYKEINFPEYVVNYGDNNVQDSYDIVAEYEDKKLVGIAFSTLQNILKHRRWKSRNRLIKNFDNDVFKIIMFDDYEITKTITNEVDRNVYFMGVKVKC